MNSGSVSSATNCFPPRQIYTGKVNEEFRIQKPKVPKAMTTGMRSNLQGTAIRGRKWQKPAIAVQLICVMTDTKSKRQLALSSNSPFIHLPWMCIIYFRLLTMYLSIHLPLISLRSTLLSPPCVLQCSCKSRDSDGGSNGGMAGGPEEERGWLLPRQREN